MKYIECCVGVNVCYVLRLSCVGVCERVQVCVHVCVSVIPRPCAGAVAPLRWVDV